MKISFTKKFDKQFVKLKNKKQEQAMGAIRLFLIDINNPKLRHHSLKGQWLGYNSISAGGDLRLHLKVINDNTILFVAIGSHSQLYK